MRSSALCLIKIMINSILPYILTVIGSLAAFYVRMVVVVVCLFMMIRSMFGVRWLIGTEARRYVINDIDAKQSFIEVDKQMGVNGLKGVKQSEYTEMKIRGLG